MGKEKIVHVSVVVLPKDEILDPQGKAVKGALESLDFNEVRDCRIGKVVRLTIEDGNRDESTIRERVSEMASALLSNPITEDFKVIVEGEE